MENKILVTRSSMPEIDEYMNEIFSVSIEMLQLLLRLGTFQLADILYNTVCVLSIENPQNRKENSPLSDREIPIIRKKHVESFRFFPYLVGKKAAFTAFCPIG